MRIGGGGWGGGALVWSIDQFIQRFYHFSEMSHEKEIIWTSNPIPTQTAALAEMIRTEKGVQQDFFNQWFNCRKGEGWVQILSFQTLACNWKKLDWKRNSKERKKRTLDLPLSRYSDWLGSTDYICHIVEFPILWFRYLNSIIYLFRVCTTRKHSSRYGFFSTKK